MVDNNNNLPERGRGGAGSDFVGRGVHEMGWQPPIFLLGSPQQSHLPDQSSEYVRIMRQPIKLVPFL